MTDEGVYRLPQPLMQHHFPDDVSDEISVARLGDEILPDSVRVAARNVSLAQFPYQIKQLGKL